MYAKGERHLGITAGSAGLTVTAYRLWQRIAQGDRYTTDPPSAVLTTLPHYVPRSGVNCCVHIHMDVFLRGGDVGLL